MFRVGSGRYSVRITDGPVKFEEKRAFSIRDELDREISISAKVPADQRLHTLFYQLAGAHIDAFGAPDVATLPSFFANAATSAIEDLAKCGGVDALKRLRPGERLGVATSRLMISNNRICRCDQTLPGSEIQWQTDPHNPARVILTAYCDFCDQTYTWKEMADPSGEPSGRILAPPKGVKGNRVGEFV